MRWSIQLTALLEGSYHDDLRGLISKDKGGKLTLTLQKKQRALETTHHPPQIRIVFLYDQLD